MTKIPSLHLNVLLATITIIISGIFLQVEAQNISYRLCIPRKYEPQCKQMLQDGNPQNSQQLTCVGANDKIDCIEKIVKNEADFVVLEPEEIYVAHRFKKNGFVIVTEIRMSNLSQQDFRYEPVAIIRKSSEINSIESLRGKKSCHTGFQRNAGWKVPFSHLMDKNQLTGLCEEITAPTTEKDLYAMSNYFGPACAPGSWVPEKTKDKELKQKYSSLCALCDDPEKCDKSDKYVGYKGALECLTTKGADVAWTKMQDAQEFFKLKDVKPDPAAANFAFLCWDGSSRPLTSPDPCSWAKRPWAAFVGTSRLSQEAIEGLQNAITHLRTVGIELSKQINIVPDWMTRVLEFNSDKDPSMISVEFHNAPYIAKRTTPEVYLTSKNYTVTIEKPSCATKSSVKICVRSEVEELKCRSLKLASLGRRILPTFQCVLGEDNLDCIQKVKKGEADVINLSSKDAEWAKRNYGLESILSELELTEGTNIGGPVGPFRYAVAVIPAENAKQYRNISDLRGKRSCHGSVTNLAGWNAVLTTLRNTMEINGQTCGLTLEMAKYFGNKTCAPGIPDLRVNMKWLPNSFCSLCAGDGPGPEKAQTPATVCANNDAERYFGDVGVFRCLTDRVADVAFTDNVELSKTLTQLNLKSEDFKLLCPRDVPTMDIDHYIHCNWGKVPSRKLMSRGGEESAIQREDAKLTLLKASDTFSPSSKNSKSDIFNLFGPFYGNKDLLFQDTSVGLCDEATSAKNNEIDPTYFNRLLTDFDYCTTSSSSRIKNLSSLTFVIPLILTLVISSLFKSNN